MELERSKLGAWLETDSKGKRKERKLTSLISIPDRTNSSSSNPIDQHRSIIESNVDPLSRRRS